MKIEQITVKNFRLLKNITLSLNEKTTVIVGRNNSGKTSLTELTRRLLGEKSPNFRLEDFSLCVHHDFWTALGMKCEGKKESEIRDALPTIEVIIKVKYDPASLSLGPLSDFLIDLDPGSNIAIVAINYRLGNGRISSFLDGFAFDEGTKSAFYKELKLRLPQCYEIQLSAIDPTDETNIKILEWSRLNTFLKSGFINAQRGLDDETYKDKDVLGKILEVLFNSASADEASEEEKAIADKLREAADGLQLNIETGFSDNLKKFLPALTLFGYPGLIDPGLSTETTIDVQRLVKDHTRIRYQGSGSVTLPETFNGLGARNLIYMLFKLFEFFKEFQLNKGEPGVHLIFIEEPEAHLHPQMQEVFIRQLSEIKRIFEQTYNDGKPWPVQFVISTHSSHIANEASFDSIRYFITGPIGGTVPYNHTRIKDLSTGLAGSAPEVRDFLHKYMTLTRCDLLFADKAILIEGATERIILPIMIAKNDAGKAADCCLGSHYVTLMEVGGAYAKNFISLLDFLEIRSLIITDIDTTFRKVGPDKKGVERTSYPECMVSEGTHTSNSTINNWFDVDFADGIPFKDLFSKTAEQKTKGNVYLTYQLPEADGDSCGRSFEGTFMLANPDLFAIGDLDSTEKEKIVWDETKEIKKTNFALEYSIDKMDWNIPRYIREGLDWLINAPVHDGTPITGLSVTQAATAVASAMVAVAVQEASSTETSIGAVVTPTPGLPSSPEPTL